MQALNTDASSLHRLGYVGEILCGCDEGICRPDDAEHCDDMLCTQQTVITNERGSHLILEQVLRL